MRDSLTRAAAGQIAGAGVWPCEGRENPMSLNRHKGKTPERTASVLGNNGSRNIRFLTRWRAGSDAIVHRTSHDARCPKYFLR